MYSFELASILSQFGKTEVEFNLFDENEIMPNIRISRSYDNKNFNIKDIDKKGQDLCIEQETLFLEQENIKSEEEIKEEEKEQKINEISVLFVNEIDEKYSKLKSTIEKMKLDDITKKNLLTDIKDLQILLLSSVFDEEVDLNISKEENIDKIKELSKDIIDSNIPDLETIEIKK